VPLRDLLRPPRHLLVMFLAVTLLLTATLVWLSWQLVRQDEAWRSSVSRSVARAPRTSPPRHSNIPAAGGGAARRLVGDARPRAVRQGRRRCRSAGRRQRPHPLSPRRRRGVPQRTAALPSDTAPAAAARDVFAQAESLEFVRENPRAATAILRDLARAGTRRSVAARSCGCQDPSPGRSAPGGADRLRESGGSGPGAGGGPPGRSGRAPREPDAPRDPGERDRVGREASTLIRDLRAGRWRLLRAEYGFYVEEAQRRLPSPEPAAGNEGAVARALAVESLWESWRVIHRGKRPPTVSGFSGSATGPF